MGGAYGGWSSITTLGNFTLNSYRDPNLKQTLENYKAIPEYLKNFDADQAAMTRYILGTISNIDRPLTPSQKGDQAVLYYLNKRTEEAVQFDRTCVINTKVPDIRRFAKMVQDVLDKNEFCVYGNADKINAEKALFQNLVNIQK